LHRLVLPTASKIETWICGEDYERTSIGRPGLFFMA